MYDSKRPSVGGGRFVWFVCGGVGATASAATALNAAAAKIVQAMMESAGMIQDARWGVFTSGFMRKR